MIRLLAFDLDGTTITEHKYLSEKNREALVYAHGHGAALVPATGRMRTFIPAAVTALPGVRYAITSNGAAVYDLTTGKALYQQLILPEKARQVQMLLDHYDVYIEYYEDGTSITKTGYPEKARTYFNMPEDKWHFIDGKAYRLVDDFYALFDRGLRAEKINLPYLAPEVREELWEKLTALGGLKLTSSLPDNIEINSAEANKGNALLFLAEHLGIDREEVMAIGDNGNDVAMLEAAGCSVAVGDGDESAVRAAKFTVAPHDQDGLAEAVYRFIAAN